MELLEMETSIKKSLGKIDISASDFTGKDEVLRQLRRKNNLYEKWATSTHEDRVLWAREFQKELPRGMFTLKKALELADKNYQEASDFYTEKNLGPVENIVSRVENDSIESSAKELEALKKSIDTTDIKQVAKNFLKYIKEFRRQVLYRELTDDERSHFEQYEETIESNIDDRDIHHNLLPYYLDRLAEIIRSKKKGKQYIRV